MSGFEAVICPCCGGDVEYGGGAVACPRCPGAIKTAGGIPVFPVRAEQLDYIVSGIRASHQFNVECPPEAHQKYTSHTLAMYESLVRVIERLMPGRDPAGLRVLDVGGGRGELALLFAGRFQAAMIDVDLHSAQIAGKLQRELSRPLTVLCGDCSALPIRSNSVDIVIAKEAAHHMADPRSFVRELGRVVADDGVVLVVEGVQSALADTEKSAKRDRMRQLGAVHHHLKLRDLLGLGEGFGDAGLCLAEPQLLGKALGVMGLPAAGGWADRVWRYAPEFLRVAALRLGGGTAVLACRGALAGGDEPATAEAAGLVDYPVELASIEPISAEAIECITEVLRQPAACAV